MTWLGLILRNLWRRPGRSLFTLMGVALAVASYLTLGGLSRGMQEGTRASLDERRIDLVVSRKGMTELIGGSLPEALEAQLKAAAGVAQVSADLDAFLDVGDGGHAVVAGWRPEDFEYREMPIARGRKPTPGRGEIVVGDQLAEALHADVGSSITVDFTPLRVVGITAFGTGLMRGSAVMPLADLQAVLSRPGEVTLYQLRLANPQDPAAVARVQARVAALAPNLSVEPSEAAFKDNRVIGMLSAGAAAVALTALAMAAMSVLNTLAMAVEERTREIGILSMIGWGRARILSLVMSEGLVLSALGGALGLVLGFFAGRAVAAFVLPGSGLELASSLGFELEAFAAALAIGLAGALWPAWRAANLTPAMAMQRQ